MLRAQAFEGLFTLVPILLFAVISIALRARASRKRKQREEAARGTQAQGDTEQGSPSSRAKARDALSRGALTRDAERMRPTPTTRAAEPGPSPQTAQFPWQRETSVVYPKRSKEARSAKVPFIPQQPRSSQVTARESYAYPPPLALDDTGLPDTTETRPGATAIPRSVVRPLVEGRVGADRMASAKKAQDLRQRMESRSKTVRTSVKVKAGKRSSISARLERLPPLKRAVIWSEILGPPGGRQ